MKTKTMQFMRRWGILLGMALAAPLIAGAQSPYDGVWRATLAANGQRCSVDLVMRVGEYSELLRCGSLMTRQVGTYVVSGGLLIRQVVNWAPRTMPVYDIYIGWHDEPTSKPPGGSYQVTFLSRDSMTWRDVNFGGTITFYRVG